MYRTSHGDSSAKDTRQLFSSGWHLEASVSLPHDKKERRPSAHAHHSAALSALALEAGRTNVVAALSSSSLHVDGVKDPPVEARTNVGGTSGQPGLFICTLLHGTLITPRVRNVHWAWSPRVHGAPSPPEKRHAPLTQVERSGIGLSLLDSLALRARCAAFFEEILGRLCRWKVNKTMARCKTPISGGGASGRAPLTLLLWILEHPSRSATKGPSGCGTDTSHSFDGCLCLKDASSPAAYTYLAPGAPAGARPRPRP